MALKSWSRREWLKSTSAWSAWAAAAAGSAASAAATATFAATEVAAGTGTTAVTVASTASTASASTAANATAAATAPSASAGSAELRLGASAALSGPAALLGRRFHAGAQACFAQLNRSGGIAGRRVVVDLRDDGYEPALAETNTRALVEDARVLALFGYVGTPTSRVALPYVRRARLPFIGAYTGADLLREPGHPEVYNIRASYQDEGAVLVQAMRAARVQRLRVLYQADLFGRAGMEAVRVAAMQAGLAVDAIATVKRNSTEVREALQTLLAAPAPDAVLLVSTYESCAAFIAQSRSVGYRGRFYLLSFTGFEPLRQALGRDMRRVTMTQVMPDPQDRNLPVVAAYQRAMADAGDRALDAISLEGYVAAAVLVEGLRRLQGPPTRAALLQALDRLGRFDLGGLTVEYDGPRRQASGYVGLRSG